MSSHERNNRKTSEQRSTEDEVETTKEDQDEEGGGGLVRIEPHYLAIPEVVESIIADMKHNYYVCSDWSAKFYVLQAYEGFIAVAYEERFLVPEMQKKYCVLDLREPEAGVEAASKLHISKRFVKKLKKCPGKLTFSINKDISAVLQGIQKCHGKDNWLLNRYAKLMKDLASVGYVKVGDSKFRILSIELWHDGILVGGEIGYTFGEVYTSLTGFCEKQLEGAENKQTGEGDKKTNAHSNFGTTQLLALGLLLKEAGFDFWNLGHPPRPDAMKYKGDIGGIILHRHAFIQKWRRARSSSQQSTESLLSRFVDGNSIEVIPIFNNCS